MDYEKSFLSLQPNQKKIHSFNSKISEAQTGEDRKYSNNRFETLFVLYVVLEAL